MAGLQVYDPMARLLQSRPQTPQPRQQRPPKPKQFEAVTGDPYKDLAIAQMRAPSTPVQPKKEGGPGGFRGLLNTGMGVVFNNPVVKAALVPLNELDKGRRLATLGFEEVVSGLGGLGTHNQRDPQTGELLDQRSNWDKINDPTYGMGQLIPDMTWDDSLWNIGDKATGLAGDIALDPLTYVGGLGVVGKGAAESGRAAAVGGRATRFARVADAVTELKNAGKYTDEIANALQDVSGRGLGVAGNKLDDASKLLVRDALDIEGPAIRLRIPGQKSAGVAIPGTQRPMEALAEATGTLRQKLNTRGAGQAAIAARSPIDYEGAIKVLAEGRKADPVNFQKAAEIIRYNETVRPKSGLYLNIGQRELNNQRGALRGEIDKFGGGRKYLEAAETGDGSTLFNRLSEYLGFELPQRQFGLTAPRLDNGLNFVPHVSTNKWLDFLEGDAAMARQQSQRYGQETMNLLGESGRVKSRSLGPNLDLVVNGRTANTGSGSMADIEKAARELGFKGEVFEYDPIKLLETYTQEMSEDFGRRAARAELAASGSDYFRFADDPAVRRPAGGDVGALVAPDVNATKAEIAAARAGGLSPQVEFGRPGALGIPNEEAMLANQRPISVSNMRNVDLGSGSVPKRVARIDQMLADDITEHLKTWDPSEFDAQDLYLRNVESGATPSTFVRVGEDGAVVIDPEVDFMLKNVNAAIKDQGALMKTFLKMTNFFKTYATLSVGFHVRNALSAIFMNVADGVGLKRIESGVVAWQKFERISRMGADIGAAEKYLNGLRRTEPNLAKAFDAVFASGAGGRFAESGVAESANMATRFGKKLQENAVTRASQRMGGRVEGGVRMGMAMDTIERGGSVQDAVSRITRVHFDYSQVSRLDEKAKRLIPFWSFTSRNLPLQVMQMWTRPSTYAHMESFLRNVGDPEALAELGGVEATPQYIRERGGVGANIGPFNFFEPDLPYKRIQEDVSRYGRALQSPAEFGAALSDFNPLITAPAEAIFKQNLYTGQRFGPKDWTNLNITNAAALPFLAMIGQADQGAGGIKLKDEWLNMLNSVFPMLDRSQRFMQVGQNNEGRGWEFIARQLGVPVRTITPKQIENESLRQQFDAQDAQARQRALDS